MFNIKCLKKKSRIIISILILFSLTLNSFNFLSMNQIPLNLDNNPNTAQESSISGLDSSNIYDKINTLESDELDLRREEKEDNNIVETPIQNGDNNNLPEINIIKEDEQGLIISFTISDVSVKNINTSTGETYQKIDIIGGGHLAEIGKPELPTKGVYLDVPRSAELIVEVKYSRYYEEYGYNVYPAQKNVPETDDSEKDIEKSTTFYDEDNFYPNTLVELKEVGIIRNHRTVLLVFYPVIYNPVSKIIRVYCKLEIEIKYAKNDKETSSITQNLRDVSRFYSNEFSSFFESIYLNYDSSVEEKLLSETSQIEADGADYLIITPDEFYDEMIPLAQHKTNKGLLTEIVNLSEIGVNPSADDISEYIQNAYDSWNPAPTYLLLVGDSNLLPPHYKTTHPYDGSLTATDLYYATVDGTDYFPDIFIGRLPVKNEVELNVVVNKIINYEQNFDQSDPWRKNITIAAYDQSGRYFIATSENISSFLETKDYNINKIYTGGSYSGTTQDVIDAINSGTFLVNHRDHGEWYGWGDPSFTVDDIDELNNGEMLPAMFSINCLSGRFDYYSQDCFAEAILKAENKGVVGIIGSTRVSYSGYNDELDKGFIASIWPEYQSSYDNSVGKSAKLGHILNFGKMYMYDKYVLTNGAGYPWGSDDFESKITFEMFTLFGDPELSIFQVDHDLQVSLEIPTNPNISNTYTINATIRNTGFEIESDINFYLYYENQEVQSINIPTLSPGESITIDYEWTSNVYGSFNFTAYTPPKPGEFYLSNNRATKFAQIKRDLIVNLEVPLKAYINKSYLIKATITNKGINQENDVELFLKLDNDLKNSTWISTLNIEESYTISYNWTPNEYGIYNITSDTPLRQGELDFNNNVNQVNKTVNPTVFYDGFENGRSNWKNVEGLWHFTSIESPWPNPCHSGSHAMWFGRESTGNFEYSYRDYGSVISTPINLSDVSSAYLSFYQWIEGEQLYPYDCGYVFISINGNSWEQLYRNGINIEPWEYTIFNISKYCGNDTVYIRFFFDTIDGIYNDYRGWLIDDVEIYTDDYSYKEKNFECPTMPPSITDEEAIPRIGYPDTLFSFIVNYTDFNNDAPVQINTIINGTPYAMIKQDNLDYDYTDGCIYNYSTHLSLTPYNYTYYFNCSDGIYVYTTNVYNDLQIHLKPTLTNESITPKLGYVDTLITFKVNYTDFDNEIPLQISVIIDGYSRSMSKQDSLDEDYTDGCIYVFTTTLSPKSNNYTYYFYCSDDGVNSISTIKYNDLKIHSKPTLTNEYLSPNIGGYSDTYFRFRVTYQDADNNAPTQINVIINGTPHAMSKYYYYDNNYVDGCLYYFYTYLSVAPYNYIYYFNCSDGMHIITTGKNNFRVHNKPTLTLESVTPKIGYADTLITFRVNYTDVDNDVPKWIYVIINYYSYAMIKQGSLDTDYTDGCIYNYSTYLSPNTFNYTYYFRYSDDGVTFFTNGYYEDLKISDNQSSMIIDNDDDDDDDDDDKKSKSDEGDDLLLPIIVVVSSISGIISLAIALFYIKKRNIKLFKPREKSVS